MKTKKAIKDFYKHADLNDISEEVVRAFELVVREDAEKEIIEKINKLFEDNNTYSGIIIKFRIKHGL